MTELETLELTPEELALDMTELEDMTSMISNGDAIRIAVAIVVIAVVLGC